MPGLWAVYRKELSDHVKSARFIILFVLICLVGLYATYSAASTIREWVGQEGSTRFAFLGLFLATGGSLPWGFYMLVAFLGPLAGLALGFDSINSERANGTLSKVLSQPVHRDSFIFGKFLAGLSTVALMLAAMILILAGMGLMMLGIPPTGEEVARLVAFFFVSVIYVAFWMALAVLFSTLFRHGATSALAGMAVWLFMFFFMPMVADAIGDAVSPVGNYATVESVDSNVYLKQGLSRVSPSTLYQEATGAVLSPYAHAFSDWDVMKAGERFIGSALPVEESLLLAWPQMVGLFCLTLLCFAISYVLFMREEIRA